MHDFLSWFFFRLAHLAFQNVNKDYVIFHIFVTLLPKVTKHKKWDERNTLNIRWTLSYGIHSSQAIQKWRGGPYVICDTL